MSELHVLITNDIICQRNKHRKWDNCKTVGKFLRIKMFKQIGEIGGAIFELIMKHMMKHLLCKATGVCLSYEQQMEKYDRHCNEI